MGQDDEYPLTQVDQENKGSRSRKRKDRASASEQSPAKKSKGGKSGRKNPVVAQLEAAGDGKEDAKASPKAAPKEKKAPAPYADLLCDFCWSVLTFDEINEYNFPLRGTCGWCGVDL